MDRAAYLFGKGRAKESFQRLQARETWSFRLGAFGILLRPIRRLVVSIFLSVLHGSTGLMNQGRSLLFQSVTLVNGNNKPHKETNVDIRTEGEDVVHQCEQQRRG